MYHVNLETGKFDICHASCPENWPFGVENHSESYEEIQIKADKINKKLNIKLTEKDKNNYELTGRYEEDIRYKIRGGYSTDDIKKAIEITEEYQILLDKAFNALSENNSFRKALLATKDATLTHSIGKNKISETVLTKQEFCQRLTCIRKRLQNDLKGKKWKEKMIL